MLVTVLTLYIHNHLIIEGLSVGEVQLEMNNNVTSFIYEFKQKINRNTGNTKYPLTAFIGCKRAQG